MSTHIRPVLPSVTGQQDDPQGTEISNPYFLESVDRVMRLLDSFTAESSELRLTDLSELLGIPKPQVMRIASTLEQGNYLERDPETKRYRLGVRLLTLGMVVQQSLNLKQVAQPLVQLLADATQETIGLFVPDRSGPTCIDVRESPMSLRVFAAPGRRMPWNAGASGKVILAYFPRAERERILETATFRRFTDRTITDSAQLRDLLEQIRCDGYHVGVGDLDEGALGIGAPVFDHHGRIAGAVSLSAPISRAPEHECPRLIELVTSCCDAISRQLGYISERGGQAEGD
jgi:IclR family transcriptional regulator, KDG regulon repressor